MGGFFQPWHLMVLFFFFGVFILVPAIFYILTLQKALEQCTPVSRTMEPALVWLLLVPFVHLVFSFFVVLALSRSLANEFANRRVTIPDPAPGQAVGLAMSICGCCCVIPLLGFVAIWAFLVLWIIYWVKIADYSRRLSMFPGAMPAGGM
jgi:hypothetical protein